MQTTANAEMAAIWDGPEGDEWTENADRYDATDRFIACRFEAEVPIEPTARVLDIGCGTGKSTRDAAVRAVSGSVLGVDLSGRMLADARRRSGEAGITNVDYVQADAQVHHFDPQSFDLAISAYGAMFFADPAAAFTNIGQALAPRGRIAFLTWQPPDRNPWLTTILSTLAAGRDLPVPPVGGPGPFGLADHDSIHRILDEAGFIDADTTSIDEPMWMGCDGDDAWEFVSQMGMVQGLLSGLDDETAQRAMKELRATLVAHHTADGVLLESASWLITARRP